MKHAIRLVLAAAIALPAATVLAQTYPAKPVRVTIPFAPGGGSDITARQVSQKLNEALGQPFVADNRGGAGGMIGIEMAVKAPADGYTLLIMSASYSATTALHKPPFNAITDITPVAEVGYTPFALAVHPSIPAKTTKEFIALIRSKPNLLTYASSGVGGITHLATELLASMAKLKMVHVPYKSTGAAMSDLLGGHVQLIVGSLLPVQPHIQTGKLRALAVTTAKRWYSVPEVPTVAESGVPGYDVELWFGVMAPKNLPAPILDRLNGTINAALKAPEMKKNLESQGMIASAGTPQAFGDRIRKDYERWTRVIKEASIKAD